LCEPHGALLRRAKDLTGMKTGSGLAPLAGILLLAACGGGEKQWQPTASALDVARAECDEQVDTRMQLRGYPRRPSPDTPQFRYRREFFNKCMQDKGYSLE
jgi:hypothetical protein